MKDKTYSATVLEIDLAGCVIESYNPEVEDGRSEARQVADQLVSKKVRDAALAQGVDIGNRMIRTRVVRTPKEFLVIPMDPHLKIFKPKEGTWKS